MNISTILLLRLLDTYLARWHLGTPDSEMGCSDQCTFRPYLYVTARPQVVLLPLHCEVDVYAFKHIPILHAKEAVHRYNRWVEVATLLESILQVITIFLLLCCQKALLRQLVLVIEVISVHNTHVVNNVCHSLPEVANKHISLLLGHIVCNRCIIGKGPLRLVPALPHGATCMDEGGFVYV